MCQLIHVTPRSAVLLVAIKFVMCCAGGCFAASLTYSCSSDKAMRADRAKSIPAVVRDVPFGSEGASQRCTVIGRNGWAPVRIDVSTRDLDDTRKYCSSERYCAMDSLVAIASVKVTFFYAEKREVFVSLYFAATVR
ncbi:putative surface protease GP63 [Trypanosoma cruzi]|nr:putative surface protease GP63 [Trypanosoma cruzi]KAF8278357.1 putative surface protease GP63 [Trypanosoma cruzi]